MTDLSQAAIDAAMAAVDELPQPVNPFEADRWRIVAEAAIAVATPYIRAGAVAAERELLAEAEAALWACAKAFLTVEPTLKTPYPDDPRWSPWTRWAERPARQAHDVCMKIRKHLKTTGGDPHA